MKWYVRRLAKRCGIQLSYVQVHKVSLEAHREMLKQPAGRVLRVLAVTNAIAIIASYCMLTGSPLYPAAIAVTSTCIYFALFLRAYRPFVYKAINMLGCANICTHCGYNLHGLPEQTFRCPECGADLKSKI